MACGWDEEVEKANSVAIEREIYRLGLWLIENAATAVLNANLVRWFHKTVFETIFPDAAGRIRGPWCPHPMTFGPHTGAAYEECEKLFEDLGREYEGYIATLDQVDAKTRLESALNVACAHHAEFINIHPFVDGNGRTGRTCVNYFALRYGLRLVEIPRIQKSDYELALAEYLLRGRRAPLVELWRPVMMPLPTADEADPQQAENHSSK